MGNAIGNEKLPENQREWQKLSDKGWARFNPYTKQYYNAIMSDELVSTEIAKFVTDNPNLQYEDTDVAQKKIQDFKDTVQQKLNQKGYRPAEIEHALTRTADYASTVSNKSLYQSSSSSLYSQVYFINFTSSFTYTFHHIFNG